MKRVYKLFFLLLSIFILSACDNALDTNVSELQARLDELNLQLIELLNKPAVKRVIELDEELRGLEDKLNDFMTNEEVVSIEEEIKKIEADIEAYKEDPEYIKLNKEITDLSNEIDKLVNEINSL